MARSRPVITGLALLCITGGALAENPPGKVGDAPRVSVQPATRPVMLVGFGEAVSTGTLERYSGGSLVQNNQTITGTVTGDTASNLSTGNNSVSGNSLSGATGLPSIVQNTGNNVLIQTGVIVNVQLKP